MTDHTQAAPLAVDDPSDNGEYFGVLRGTRLVWERKSAKVIQLMGASATETDLETDQPSTGDLGYRTVGDVVYQDTPSGWAVADNIGEPFTSAERATAVPTQAQVDAQELRLDTDLNILYRPTGLTAGAYVPIGKDSEPDITYIMSRLGLATNDPDWGDRQGTNYDNVASLTALLDAIITALENLNVTGQPVAPYRATFATLEPVPADTDGDNVRYWTVLTADDIGTGDAANPQYPAGLYLTGLNQAAGWNFGASLGGDIIELTLAEMVQKAGDAEYDADKSGIINIKGLDAWGLSRRMRRVFNHVGPGDFDFIGLGYPDRTAVYVRNTDTVNGINVTYGTGGTTARELTRANGTADNSTNEDAFNVQPSEIVVMEKDGNTVYASIIPAERVTYFDNYAQANAAPQTPHDGLVVIRETGEIFGRKTNFNGRVFPADGQENDDWFKVGPGVKSVTTVQQTALGVVDTNTVVWNIDLAKFQKYDTSTDVFNVVFGTTHQPSAINWPSNATSGSGLNFKVTEDPDATAGVASITLPDGTEKQIWIIAQQVSGETPNVGGAATIAGTAIIRNDAGVVSLVSIPNESRWHNAGSWATLSYNQVPNLVTDPIDVTNADVMRIFSNVPGAGNWVDATASAGNTVVYPGASDNMQVGVINIRYQDDPALIPAQIPAPVLGQEYVVTVLPVNRGVTTGTIEGETTHYFCVDRGAGPEWIGTKGGGGVSNALVYPVGNFVALPVNDGATGEDGAVYWLPAVDALEITLPDKATMDIATGIYRVQISADWAGLAAQTTPLSFIDDTANGLSMGEGFPVEGQEAIDLFMDPAGDRWILTSGDRVTLDQITPSYDEFAEVPLTVRQFLMTGNGAPPEGSYRRQVADNAPQLIG